LLNRFFGKIKGKNPIEIRNNLENVNDGENKMNYGGNRSHSVSFARGIAKLNRSNWAGTKCSKDVIPVGWEKNIIINAYF
jgi:hypothetical protein